MGAGFCNFGQLGWNTQTPIPPSSLHDQRIRNSRKVGREDEGVSSTQKRKYDAGTTEETIVIDRLWNKRPDGFAIKKPTETKGGELVILEFKRMSCVTDQYVKRAKHVAEAQYAPIKSDLRRTLGLDREPKKLHSRSKIPERGGLARQPHRCQGPVGRHRLH
jgi:hypothetical protein